MKRIFALLSLFAMLMVAFTSQAFDFDHTVKMGMETQKVFALSLQKINVVADCDFEVRWYRCNESDSTIFATETSDTFEDLPFKVGWCVVTTNIICNLKNQVIARKDLPNEVGWCASTTTNIISASEKQIITRKDLPFEVGWNS